MVKVVSVGDLMQGGQFQDLAGDWPLDESDEIGHVKQARAKRQAKKANTAEQQRKKVGVTLVKGKKLL